MLKMLVVSRQKLRLCDRNRKPKDLPKKLRTKLFKIVLKRRKPSERLLKKRLLQKLKRNDLKQKRPQSSLLSKQQLQVKQMDQMVNLNYKNKKHYRKLRRRSLQRKRRPQRI